jgi:hypothetical protein
MSITFEEAYSSVKYLYDDMFVSSYFENDEEWIFPFKRKDRSKPPVPGDWTSPAVVNKSDGSVIRLSDRLGDGLMGLVRFDPLASGYQRIDLPAAARSEPAAALRVASA